MPNYVRKLRNKQAKRAAEWYSIRSLLGYSWAIFYFMIGGREVGKLTHCVGRIFPSFAGIYPRKTHFSFADGSHGRLAQLGNSQLPKIRQVEFTRHGA